MFKPRELLLLRALHATGSVTEAAARVHLSQPAASALIRAVETRLGFDLFVRENRKLRLTANGRTLLPELLNAAAALESADRLASDLRAGWSRQLIVGAVPVLGVALLPDAIAAARRREPAGAVLVRTGTTITVSEMAADQRVDLGVVIGSIADERLAEQRIGVLSLCAVMHPEHPLARRRMTLALAASVPYIALSRELPVGLATARQLEQLGLPWQPALEVTQTASACALVSCQAGLAIVESTGADFAKRSGLTVRRLVAVPGLTLNVVWARGRGLSEGARRFVDDLAERGRRMLGA